MSWVHKTPRSIMTSIVDAWSDAVSVASQLGAWYCNGDVKAPKVIISEEYLEAMHKNGSESKVHEVPPSAVSFDKLPAWKKALEGVKSELRRTFVKKDISLQLVNMVLVSQGEHNIYGNERSEDRKKLANFGVLIISLPEGECDGGNLSVTYPSGQYKPLTLTENDNTDNAPWCAFTADCRCDMLPLSRGKKALLVYHVHSKDKTDPVDATTDGQTPSMLDVINCALSKKNHAFIMLEHVGPTCTPRSLKGFDRLMYEYLTQHRPAKTSLRLVSMELHAEHHWYHCDTPHVDFKFVPGKHATTDSLVGMKEGTTFYHRDSYQYSKGWQYTVECEDPLVLENKEEEKKEKGPARKKQKIELQEEVEDSEGSNDNYEEEDESDEEDDDDDIGYDSGDEYHGSSGLKSTYFNDPHCAFLFQGASFEDRERFDYDLGGGYESPPESLNFKFFMLIVSKAPAK